MTRLLLSLVLLAGCTQFPQLDETRTPGIEDAPYPRLVPLDDLIREPRVPQARPEVIDEVEARAGGLRDRATALQGRQPVQQTAVQDRLDRLRQKAAELRRQ